MMYTYHTAQGNAVLNKGDDFALVKIGTFKTEAEAIKACKDHYLKAHRACVNLGKQIPPCHFV